MTRTVLHTVVTTIGSKSFFHCFSEFRFIVWKKEKYKKSIGSGVPYCFLLITISFTHDNHRGKKWVFHVIKTSLLRVSIPDNFQAPNGFCQYLILFSLQLRYISMLEAWKQREEKVLVFDLSIAWISIWRCFYSQCATQLHRPILWIAGIRNTHLPCLNISISRRIYENIFVCLCFYFACELKDSSCTSHTVNVCARGKWIWGLSMRQI